MSKGTSFLLKCRKLSLPHKLISRYCMLQGRLSLHSNKTTTPFLGNQIFPQNENKVSPGYLNSTSPSEDLDETKFRVLQTNYSKPGKCLICFNKRAENYHSVQIEVTWGKKRLISTMLCWYKVTGAFQYFL